MPEVRVDDSLAWAVSWTAREPLERSSHALAADGRVWFVDPIADEGALAAAERLGEPAAVLQLLDRHPRDCRKVAERYGVPHLRVPREVGGSPFEVRRVVWVRRWREVCLWWPEHAALVVPEAVGTAAYVAVGGARLGVHTFLRPCPPRVLRELEPRAILPGHGPPLHEAGADALREALARSRRDLPRALVTGVRVFSPSP